MRLLLTFIFILLASATSFAESPTNIPYYASIKADEANVRTGPSVRYPIQWVYKKPNWPIKVTATFEMWRKISDIDGEAGWIHESLLSGRRYAMGKGESAQEVYQLPIKTAAVVMIMEGNAIARLLECKSGWCKISAEDEKGWIQSSLLWGVEENEQTND